LALAATLTYAADITWIGGNANWVDAGGTANWSPADEPDADDTAIFNTPNTVILGSNNSILALTMSAGIDLNTSNFDLDVNGLVQLTAANTNLIVGAADSLLTADRITINSGANLETGGGTIQINEESGNGVLDINAGGEFLGHGTLSMTDVVGAATTLIINDGIINARRTPAIIVSPPPVGTLSISATDVDTRIDLDGAGELGEVIVGRNQTLDINIQLADTFNGSMSMAQSSVLDVSTAWVLGAGATIDVNNGATGGLGGAPAGVATIAGAGFSQNSGTITVVDNDGTLQFDAPFSANGGSIVNNGTIVFNSSTTIAAPVAFTMPTTASSITVAANRTVNINANNFNMDGSNALTNAITVEAGGELVISTTDYDPDQAANAFDGTITINSGSLSVNTSDAEFVMDGTLNMNKSGAPVAEWEGNPLDIGNDAGALDANLNIGGNGNTLFHSQVDFNSDADVDIAAGNGLILNLTTNFNTVNGVNNAQFTGGGAIRFNGQVNVNEAVTFNMTGGTVDLDGLDTVTGDTVNVDAPLMINAATMESFGKVNTAGVNTLDINNSVGTGVLTVNLDNAGAEWTLNAAGVMNLVNDNTVATLLAGSGINMNGTVNVTGDVRTTARLDIGSTATININTTGNPFRLNGGNAGPNVNTISGGTISGAGLLGADTNKRLHGFGTINADIDFDGNASLLATGGTLTIGGDIVDMNILGTADDTGTLNVVNAWETDGGAGGSIGAIVLAGGVLQGGQITNDNANGIQGHGTVTSRVINNSKLVATNGGTLIFQTAGNNNDWDGATNTGELQALSADLELVDTTMPVPPVRQFGGKVRAINDNRVFANGFALDFNPGSSLELEDEAIYRASSSTDIGGTVTIAAGADATVQVANNFFLTFETGSATTLNGNLRLLNNNINIEQGATFSGTGALVVPDGSHLVIDNQGEVGVLLDMQGAFRPGNFNGIGRVELFDYQSTATSELFVELIGTALNQFDRLVLDGDAIIDGYLNIDIDEVSPGVPFVPALGNTFNIITGSSVTGEFDFADVSGMPAGLAFAVHYLPNAVQLQVVNKPIFSADFDDDGDVDQTDFAIWDGAYNLNQLGDADGDSDSDGADLILWQRQFGSRPGPPPAGAVPEPTSLALLIACSICGIAFSRHRIRKRIAIASAILACALAHTAAAQNVNLSLNLQYTNPANTALGGDWTLVAKTDSAHGISLISAILSNIDHGVGEVTAQTGIGAFLNGGVAPFVTVNGTIVEVVYLQDLGNPASVVTNVGRGAGTPGNVALDFLNDPQWNNSARIYFGTFGASTPAFTTNGDNPPDVTAANVLRTGVPPYTFALPASVTTVVRDNLGASGDVWDNTSGSGLWSDAVNWTDDTEPTAGSGVTFPVGFPNGDSVVTLSAAETAASLILNDNYTLSGGSLTLPSGATISVAAGQTATITSALDVDTWTKSGDGSLAVPNVQADALTVGAGAVVIAPGGGTSALGSLTIAGGMAPTAKLDLNNNAAIVNYTGASPVTTIRQQILAGRGGPGFGATWNGLGITSSTAAAADPESRSVGFAENGTMPLGPYANFRGQPVDNTSVLIAFTRTGDANLDGLVNDDDVTIVGATYAPGVPNANWAMGDFDYNGFVDDDDVTLLGVFYDPSAPPAAVSGLESAGVSAVPEPGSLTLILIPAALFVVRRRATPREPFRVQ
jgi:hypothetical protein